MNQQPNQLPETVDGLNPFNGFSDPARKQMYGNKLTDVHGGNGVICEVAEDKPFVAGEVVYPAHIVLGGEGRFIVSFRDIPEAITQGDDFTDMMHMATDALSTALDFYEEDKRPIPMPSPFQHGEIAIALSVNDVIRLRKHNDQEFAPDGWKYKVVINGRRPVYCMNEEETYAALGKRKLGDSYFVYDTNGGLPAEFVAY